MIYVLSPAAQTCSALNHGYLTIAVSALIMMYRHVTAPHYLPIQHEPLRTE
jgi:hypothetical protein